MAEKLSAEEILDLFQGQVDGGFHWPYDGPRKATVVGTKVEPDTYDGSRLEVSLTLVVDDDERPDHTVSYSVGNINTFESPDGVSIQGIDGARMRNNAWFQAFNNCLIDQDDAKAAIIDRGMSPLNTQYCVGLTATFEPVEVKFGKDKQTGEAIVGVRPMPVEFISLGDADAAAAPAAAAPAAAVSDEKAADVMGLLKTLAGGATDAQDFMTKALAPGVNAPADLTTSIVDGSLYAELTS